MRLTNELFALDDPELQREGEDRQVAIMELAMELYSMFDSIIQDRRSCPRDDLASVLANGMVNGAPMEMMETVGYYLIVFSAGHDTTKNALVGGMNAFFEHPDELARLQHDPDLIDQAVEELTRWTSPVNYMKRTATEDAVIGGQQIAAGDSVVMFYASANRDEDVFDDPFRFRIDRKIDRHLAFGVGEHFCLGSQPRQAIPTRALGRARIETGIGRADRPTRMDPFCVRGRPQASPGALPHPTRGRLTNHEHLRRRDLRRRQPLLRGRATPSPATCPRRCVGAACSGWRWTGGGIT